jgi:uroporphyrinogen decarboxylase
VSVDYLAAQVAAGADTLQIFDSWAGSLPDTEFDVWVVAPTRAMVAQLNRRCPGVPIIGFPRGAGARALSYVRETGVDAIGCDTAMPLGAMAELAAAGVVAQGNLDPLRLVAGGDGLARRVEQILEAMRGRPFIFNLGHGIVPETPPEHVARLVEFVRRERGAAA